MSQYLAGERHAGRWADATHLLAVPGTAFNVSMGRLPEDELPAFAEGSAPGARVVPTRGAMLGYTDAEAA